MTNVFSLKAAQPVAAGGRRLVFAHPDDPRLIIKVYRPEFLEREWGNPSWRQKKRRYRHLFPLFQEVREHIAICAAEGRPPKHMQNLVGFAETDYGLGLVYDAVFDGAGNYAPTLQMLIRDGRYTPEIASAFREFRDWLIETPIVVLDLRPANFVCAHDESGKPYFVIIDGIGEKTIIPIKGFVRWLNRRSKKRHLAVLERRLNRLGVEMPR
jgi:hypothetical protein